MLWLLEILFCYLKIFYLRIGLKSFLTSILSRQPAIRRSGFVGYRSPVCSRAGPSPDFERWEAWTTTSRLEPFSIPRRYPIEIPASDIV